MVSVSIEPLLLTFVKKLLLNTAMSTHLCMVCGHAHNEITQAVTARTTT
jgi:hypothetical protein